MASSRDVLRTLEQCIDRELGLYQEYLAALLQEKQFIQCQDTEKIQAISQKRQLLCNSMKEAEEKRLDYIKSLPGDGANNLKLSEFVKANFSAVESKRLLGKVELLKDLVKRCHRESTEFRNVVDFSLNMVSGLISIFWSATQSVVRSYTQNGRMRESYAPSVVRSAGLLKQV